MPDFADFPFAGPQLATIAAYGMRFKAFCDLKEPLEAIVEAAHLKGRLAVLMQLGMFDPNGAVEARQLIDLALASIIDTFTTSQTLSLPIEDLLPRLQDQIRTL